MVLPRSFIGFKGDGNSGAMFGCLNSGEKMDWGCSTSKRSTYTVGFTDVAEKDETLRNTLISQINVLGGAVSLRNANIFINIGDYSVKLS